MTINKAQHGFSKGNRAVVSRGMSDKEFQFFSFKKALNPSTKDYVIVTCLAVVLFVLFTARVSINPLEYFHVVSIEQLHAMVQENFSEIALGKFKEQSLEKSLFLQKQIIELWRGVQWNGVWAFLSLLPTVTLGCLIIFFPFFAIFLNLLQGEVKEMLEQLEEMLKQQDTHHSTGQNEGTK